jgi:L-asparaginase
MTKKSEEVHIIATGGTIDKVYSPSEQATILPEKSKIPNYLQNVAGVSSYKNFTPLMMIDSRDMTEDHRALLLNAINRTLCENIVITHGTDTMVETALYLQERLKNVTQTIILTGAMVPMEGFIDSDAGFNLGYAMATAQQKEHGVYICMNGKVFAPQEVQKNISASRFESTQ